MNHDYAHCADYQKDCPASCFRAQLVRDLETNANLSGVWVSWMALRGTEECGRKDHAKR